MFKNNNQWKDYSAWLFSRLDKDVQNYITYPIFKKIIFFWEGMSLFWIFWSFYKFRIILEFFESFGSCLAVSSSTFLFYLIVMHIWPLVNFYCIINYFFIWTIFLQNWLKQKFNIEKNINNCIVIIICGFFIATLFFYWFLYVTKILLIYTFFKTIYGLFFYFSWILTFYWIIVIIYYFIIIRNKNKF